MGRYPFRLAATSLTYPHRDVVYNVAHLPPAFDGIEFMMEYPITMPLTSAVRSEVERMVAERSLSVTVHLPLSVQLASTNPWLHEASLRTVEEALAAVAFLRPQAYVLHVTPLIPLGRTPLGRMFEVQMHRSRLEAAWKGLSRLCDLVEPQRVAVENLQYSFAFVDEMVKALDLGVCMDVAHLRQTGDDVFAFYERWRSRIRVIHLHDLAGSMDHQPVDQPDSPLQLEPLLLLLQETGYNQTLVLEQFDLKYLRRSLDVLLPLLGDLSPDQRYDAQD